MTNIIIDEANPWKIFQEGLSVRSYISKYKLDPNDTEINPDINDKMPKKVYKADMFRKQYYSLLYIISDSQHVYAYKKYENIFNIIEIFTNQSKTNKRWRELRKKHCKCGKKRCLGECNCTCELNKSNYLCSCNYNGSNIWVHNIPIYI